MRSKRVEFIWCICFIVLMASCKNNQSSDNQSEINYLASDDGLLDLSLSTIEQQNIEKMKAEKFLLEARQKRKIVQVEDNEEHYEKSQINLALYARQTSNKVGRKIYNRTQLKKRKLDPCLRFVSSDDAQRFFLEKNGPENDAWSLDPDGDGFACQWSPNKYRELTINLNN